MIVAATLLLAAAALAQEAPKPGPEHKKLDVFAGTWMLDGDVKPGPMGSGGKMNESQRCEWMEGGFFLVCHADFRSVMGNGSGFSLMGYSADDKAYTYYEFNSWGEATNSRGSVDGDTWTWINDEKMGNTTMKGRFIMKLTSATSYTFTFELSPDGTKWNTIMDGKATKEK
jgi:Protein of unknown function (DUF1579)